MTLWFKSLPFVAALWILSFTAASADAGTLGVELFVDGALVGGQTAEPNPDGPVPINFAATDIGYAISGSALLDIDPFITFSLTVTNFGENPVPFAFGFFSPYAGGPFNTLLTEFSSTVTDFFGDGGATVIPSDASGVMSIPQIDGVDIAGGALGGGCVLSGLTILVPATCDPFSSASVSLVTLADGQFGVNVAFLLSGGDSLTANGRVELTNTAVVPEPVSIILIGLGVGAAAVRRRFSNAS